MQDWQPASATIAEPLDAQGLTRILPEILASSLPGFLAGRRWYGHKQERITDLQLADLVNESVGKNIYALASVALTFANQGMVTYFMPLVATTKSAMPEHTLAVVNANSVSWSIVDAPTDEGFRQWLLAQLASGAVEQSAHEAKAWIATRQLAAFLPDATTGPSQVMRAEQSNSSVLYGRSIMLKIFRRIEAGINPDIEVGRFLTTQTRFRNMPLLLGEWREVEGREAGRSIAVAQSFIESIADGWEYALSSLAAGRPAGSAAWPFTRDAAVLGVRTAQLHLALASDENDPAFSPEPIIDEDIVRWTDHYLTSLERTSRLLAARASAPDEPVADLIQAFEEAAPVFRMRASAFERLLGRSKTRVHGDYHLGQTLRTEEGDFAILDFEGEPQRSVAERRAKTSPLKDVAGMLRSFSYARGAAERALVEHPEREARVSDLIAWERSARLAFLDAYLGEAQAQRAAFLPRTREDFREALGIWELDKALYEIAYEINNRPDWLWLPLASALKLA
jgi:maltose alpha-D-glucosyltransferase/alpha-amylase